MIGQLFKLAKCDQTKKQLKIYLNLKGPRDSNKRQQDILHVKNLFLSELLQKKPFVQISMIKYLKENQMSHYIDQSLYNIILFQDISHEIFFQNLENVTNEIINTKINILLKDLRDESNLDVHRYFLQQITLKYKRSFALFCYCLCNPNQEFLEKQLKIIPQDIHFQNIQLYLSETPITFLQNMKEMNYFTLYILYKYHFDKISKQFNEKNLNIIQINYQKIINSFFEKGIIKIDSKMMLIIQNNKFFPI